MELIFPTATLMVLRFEWVARKVLITHQCLGKILGQVTARLADPNWPKKCSTPYYTHSTIKGNRKEDKEGRETQTQIHISYLWHLSFRATITCAWKWLGDEKKRIKYFVFLHFCTTFAFALLNCLCFNSWVFFHPEEWRDRAAWWESDVQQSSIHPN